MDRVLLLMSPATYRAGPFLAAAERLGLPVVVGLDTPPALQERWAGRGPLGLDFSDSPAAVAAIVAAARRAPFAAVLSVDDSATLIAAEAGRALGLPHNDPAAALAARDKFIMRERLAAAGVPVPAYRLVPLAADPATLADQLPYPCVVKPRRLSGSRGVIRADDPAAFVAAFARTRRLLLEAGADPEATTLLVEEYLPGVEVALEALLTGGELRVLALFDKPDPLEGPFFEETIYVTPSRLPAATQTAIAARTAEAAAALGLREGPVHAELRINEAGVWPIALAGRSIGGLCSTILEFGTGATLEELILCHAVGRPLPGTERRGEAAGAMMIPIPRGGLLHGVTGREAALAVLGIAGLEITAKLRHPIVPLPEGDAYLGFIFARAATPAAVEAALRQAHACLKFDIRPTIPLAVRR